MAIHSHAATPRRAGPDATIRHIRDIAVGPLLLRQRQEIFAALT